MPTVEPGPPSRDPWDHDRTFRVRRALNWGPLGATYALLYTARYNFTVANVSIACERGWGIGEVSKFITVGLAAYAFSTFLNGPLADRIGGRRAILIAAFGAALCNLAFGALGGTASITALLLIWGLNGYFQSFGALSVVKVNAAWFHVRERGSFGGIFGTIIQSGRWLVLSVGGFLLAAFGWRSLYFVPGALLLFAFAANLRVVRDTPEQAGLPRLDTGDEAPGERDVPATLGYVLRKIFTSRVAWAIAGANFCTGFVRHGIEQYWRVFYGNVFHLSTSSLPYQVVANIGFVSGVVGAMSAGVVSDVYFGSRRGPVACLWYLGQVVMLVGLALVVPDVRATLSHGPGHVNCAAVVASGNRALFLLLGLAAVLVTINVVAAQMLRPPVRLAWFAAQILAIVAAGFAWSHVRGQGGDLSATAMAASATTIIVLLQFLIGGAHGLLAGTASMDYGGRKAAATAAGFFDGVQYLAGSVGGIVIGGALAAHGWRWWIPTITPFALGGAGLMALLWRSTPAGSASRAAAH